MNEENKMLKTDADQTDEKHKTRQKQQKSNVRPSENSKPSEHDQQQGKQQRVIKVTAPKKKKKNVTFNTSVPIENLKDVSEH